MEINKKKFQSGDKILDRLMWDKSINIDQFTVGYEDRFLGVLEVKIHEFINN